MSARHIGRMTPKRRRLRALMISDVYFPRINGVSTSIETFRRDLRSKDPNWVLVETDDAA